MKHSEMELLERWLQLVEQRSLNKETTLEAIGQVWGLFKTASHHTVTKLTKRGWIKKTHGGLMLVPTSIDLMEWILKKNEFDIVITVSHLTGCKIEFTNGVIKEVIKGESLVEASFKFILHYKDQLLRYRMPSEAILIEPEKATVKVYAS